MSPVLVGVGGVKRNACAAVCVDGEIRAACEQERVTRVRGAGMPGGELPAEAIDEALAAAGCRAGDVDRIVCAEADVRRPANRPGEVVDHHQGHAATAFLTSPHASAAVLVCDSSDREVSVWLGRDGEVHDRRWPWRGAGFASLYSALSELFGFPRGQEHRLEALARLGRGDGQEQLRMLFRYEDGTLHVDPSWRTSVSDMLATDRRDRDGQPVETAASVQRVLGEQLLAFVADIHADLGVDALCLGGGLFFNTGFTTLLRTSGPFADVFVPVNPGNAGLAVGAPLLLAGKRAGGDPNAGPSVSPFLGPGYDPEAIKAALDGCKLSYSFASQTDVLDQTADALVRGRLVGWFHGRMEWGHRALGHRSILAYPDSPYVLDNLNFHLRKRERWRPFGISTCADAAPALVCGPSRSPCMEFEHTVRTPRLRHVLPGGATAIRVQTVERDMPLFWELHKRVERATGLGALVNTSFNGFHEPIVCTPRDAVRVFYGTGLDMLVMDRFLLTK